MAKGVKSITGNSKPVVGEQSFYEVSSFYPGTPAVKSENIKWKLFVLEKSGRWRELRDPQKTGKKVSFTFPEKWIGRQLLIEAFLYKEEKKTPPGLIVKPQPSKIPRITGVELLYVDDTKGKTFSYKEKLRVRATTVGMFSKELTFTLWEDDAIKSGHNPKNKLIEVLNPKPKVNIEGIAVGEFVLSKALIHKALQGETDPRQLEFYATVEYFSNNKHATKNYHLNNPLLNEKPAVRNTSANNHPVTKPREIPKAKGSPAESKPKSKKEEAGIFDKAMAGINSAIDAIKNSELWDWGEAKGTIKKEQPATQTLRDGKAATSIAKSQATKSQNGCYCYENRFYWSKKLTCEERKKVLSVCAALWGEENKVQKASELMAVMHLETNTSFKPSSDNGAGYVGLIQFSATSASHVGTTQAALKKMTFIEQMDYVKAYFEKNSTSINTMTDLYLLVLKPTAAGHGAEPNYVLFDESIEVPDVPYDKNNIYREPWVTKYGYASNATFFREKGEYINKRKFKTYTKGIQTKRGFDGGKTYVWEVTDVLVKEHYNLGKSQVYDIPNCNNQINNKAADNKEKAPWMKIAINIAKEMKGCTEEKEPMYTKAKSYLRYCNNSYEPTDGENGPWCAAFMNWTIGQTGYSHAKSAASLAPLDKVAGKKYKQIDQPIYGCIVVYKHTSKWKGHTGFLYGKTKAGRYILLGGNQDNTIRFDNYGEYTSNSKKKKLYGFYIPVDYEIKESDYLNQDDIYETSNEINIKYGIVAKKSTGKTN